MNELKAKCDAIEKREAERRTIEEKKHAEEIQFLKRTNQQLKVLFSLRISVSIKQKSVFYRYVESDWSLESFVSNASYIYSHHSNLANSDTGA